MKIGVITYSNSNDNYGQILQCWALQTYLKNIGHSPYLIRYKDISFQKKNSRGKKLLKVLLIYPAIQSILKRKKTLRINKLKKINEERNKQRNFIDFKERYITYSKREYINIEDLRNDPPQADCYITGSDQVWGDSLLRENTKAYFLDFGSNTTKRIAYSASFGRDEYPTEEIGILKNMLNPFNAISVREQSGINICRSCCEDAIMTVDPTLLLKRHDYESFISPKSNNEDYIFIYSLNIIDKAQINWDNLRNFANNNNLKIIVTQSSGYFEGDEIFDGVEYRYATIDEWLWLIKYAKMVITPSFHGIVFSYIFQTPFIFAPIKDTKYSKGNNRIFNLCSMMDIKPYTTSNGYSDKIYSYYEWDKMNNKLCKSIDKSKEFLSKCFC